MRVQDGSKMLKLREYQHEASDALINSLSNRDCNPLVVAPTGSGKSILIAEFCRRVLALNKNARILIVQHRKELIQQNFDKLVRLINGSASIGIYSAALGSKQLGKHITCAGIASIYRNSFKLQKIDFIIIDEAHLLPSDGEGMYQTLIADLRKRSNDLRVVGFTATPFRMKSGSLIGEDTIFNSIAYDISMTRLIREGFLSPLVSKASQKAPDISSVQISKGEYKTGDLEKVYSNVALFEATLSELRKYASDRKRILIFCSSVKHSEEFSLFLREKGELAESIVGKSDPLFRAEIIAKFREGRIRVLCNVDVLTTGFDAPETDCIVLLRATKSAGLLVQMVGRGTRNAPGKSDCLVLDFGGNLERHGPVDRIKIEKRAIKDASGKFQIVETLLPREYKVCSKCRSPILKVLEICPKCGAKQTREIKHDRVAADMPVTSIDPVIFDVIRTEFDIHQKEGKPPSLRVGYQVSTRLTVNEYLCFEHGGYAAQKARSKWELFLRPDIKGTILSPALTQIAYELAEDGALRLPKRIRAIREARFWRVQSYEFHESGNDIAAFLASYSSSESLGSSEDALSEPWDEEEALADFASSSRRS